MAVATVSPGLSIDFNSLDLHSANTISNGPTLIHRVNSVTNYHDFIGTGFTFDDHGNITGGTLTGFTEVVNGLTHLSVTGISIPATTLQAYFDAPDLQAFLGAVFAGNDAITGSSFADEIAGFDGSDTLDGKVGADHMLGGKGDDLYFVDNANDQVDETGGDGNDTVVSSVSFTLPTGVEDLTLTGSTQPLTGTGNGSDNAITGNAGNNSLSGGDGADTLDGGAGNDSMNGGAGDDTYIVDSSGDKITGDSSGTDTVLSSVSFSLASLPTIENVTLTGGANTSATGNALSNILIGNAGNNTLDGGANTDPTHGDTMQGGAGDDTYIVHGATDVVDETGGDGTDTVQSSISFNLTENGTTVIGQFENLVLTGTSGISGTGNDLDNKITGNSGANSLDGGNGNDTLDGGAGADTMDGGAGNDTYVVDNTKDVVNESGPQDDVDLVQSSVTFDLNTNSNLENLTLTGGAAINGFGNSGANYIKGNDAANIIDGRIGDDTMEGLGGNDQYFVDSQDDQVIEQPGGGNDTVTSSVSFDLSTNGLNVEVLDLVGTNNGSATGNNLNNFIFGDESNNQLDGGIGADTMIGGQGDDRYIVDNTGDAVWDIVTGKDKNGNTVFFDGGGDDTVRSFISFSLNQNGTTVIGVLENLELQGDKDINGLGNDSNNLLKGNVGNNILDGQAGADTMDGGKGNDTYVVDNAGDSVIESLANEDGGGIDTVQSSVTFAFATGDNLDNLTLTGKSNINGTGNELDNALIGNDGNNQLFGADGKDSLSGGLGNDTLDGGTGADTMAGGAGDDVYVVDNKSDVIIEAANGGTDELQTSLLPDDYAPLTHGLLPNIENYTFTGIFPVSFTGSAANNHITGTSTPGDSLAGGAGDDTLDGGLGADTLAGGAGNDLYILDNTGDVIQETGNDKGDTVASAVFSIDLRDKIGADLKYANIENATLLGTADLNLTGNDGNNVLTGNDGKNSIAGLGGNDTLFGGAGDDTLNGGTGNDSMAGGDGADIYFIDSKTDKISEGSGANSGFDFVETPFSYTLGANVEGIVLLGTANINATGNNLTNFIIGNSGNNFIDGGLNADFVGTGDTMLGGAGDDTYLVRNDKDVVQESLTTDKDGNPIDAGGHDLVESYRAFTLGAFVEDLTLLGHLDVSATGNNLANVLTGNDGKNLLEGGLNTDTKTGDTMIGGAGNDTYVIDNPNDVVKELANGGTDEIQTKLLPDDYAPATHGLIANVENYTFKGAIGVSFAGDSHDNKIIGTGQNLLGTAPDDSLDGGGGNDTLDGNFGNDTLRGGLGNDVLIVTGPEDVVIENPGEGQDTLLFNAPDNNLSISLLDPAYDNIENLTIGGFFNNITGIGDEQNNVIDGNGLDNTLKGMSGNDTIFGETGNDTIDGGTGADSMRGGFGNDVYYVDNKGDKIFEDNFKGSEDKVILLAAMSYTLGANVEDLDMSQLTGADATANINGTGTNDAFAINNIIGNDGNNLLKGLAGNDSLVGNGGNDTLDGGTGFDGLRGGAGNDTYLVDNLGDVVSEDANGGIDTVIVSSTSPLFFQYAMTDNVENLTLTGTILTTVFGNDLDNTIIGNAAANKLQGESGNDSISGGAGNDSLDGSFDNDTLDGGAGVDTMSGGFGDDTYIVDNTKDVISEFTGSGTDTVKASVSYALPSSDGPVPTFGLFENLTLTGSGAISGTGNSLDNVITGNKAANTLTGNDGNDTLIGGGGNDIMVGGHGNDQIDVSQGNCTVRYTSTLDGKDVINGFDANPSGGQDTLNLDALFDSLGISTANRAAHVSYVNNSGSIDVNVDFSTNPTPDIHTVATLNLTNPADTVTTGQDVIVGTG